MWEVEASQAASGVNRAGGFLPGERCGLPPLRGRHPFPSTTPSAPRSKAPRREAMQPTVLLFEFAQLSASETSLPPYFDVQRLIVFSTMP